MAISLNQSILKAKNSDGEWQNLSAIGQIEGYTKSETDTLFNAHTPQLLFSGVTSSSAPAVVDLSGYGMVEFLAFHKNESGTRSLASTSSIPYYVADYVANTSSNHEISFPWGTTAQIIYKITSSDDKYTIYCTGSGIEISIYGITQHTNLAITSQPSDVAVAVGSTATFHVDAVGDALAYQWQAYTTTNPNWIDLTYTSAYTSSCNVAGIDRCNGWKFRCIVTDKYGATITSDVATLTVTNLAIATQPTDQTVAVGETATFSVVANGDGLAYQWKFSNDNGKNWYNASLAGNKSATMPVEGITARNGLLYKCVITDKYGATVTSSVATLTVTS